MTTATVILERNLRALGYGEGLNVDDTYTLPDGRNASGRITSVGTVATAGDKQDGQQNPVTFPVTVALDDPTVTGVLDGAPITVNLRGTVHKGVFTVPVDALLALAEGGFGVQVVVEDGSERIVAVELGAFANGKVAVEGVVALRNASAARSGP